jgi:predicted nuclease with TOPRIM domain
MNFRDLLSLALQKTGKNEALASALDLSPSDFSKRVNGQTGWQESDINKLLDLAGAEIASREDTAEKINVLKKALKIVLEDGARPNK